MRGGARPARGASPSRGCGPRAGPSARTSRRTTRRPRSTTTSPAPSTSIASSSPARVGAEPKSSSPRSCERGGGRPPGRGRSRAFIAVLLVLEGGEAAAQLGDLGLEGDDAHRPGQRDAVGHQPAECVDVLDLDRGCSGAGRPRSVTAGRRRGPRGGAGTPAARRAGRRPARRCTAGPNRRGSAGAAADRADRDPAPVALTTSTPRSARPSRRSSRRRARPRRAAAWPARAPASGASDTRRGSRP